MKRWRAVDKPRLERWINWLPQMIQVLDGSPFKVDSGAGFKSPLYPGYYSLVESFYY